MMPRHVGIIGFDQRPKAETYFAGVERFAGTQLFIQFANDPEAKNLANEIEIAVIRRGGWRLEFIDGARSHVPTSNILEGVHVLYPIGKPYSRTAPKQPWFAWENAAAALAHALTNAGLGVADMPAESIGFENEASDPSRSLPHFDPPLTGVYLQIGPRPISLTLQWLASRRPAVAK